MAKPNDNQIIALVALMRPRQWTKNVFVLAPLLFGRKLDDPTACWTTFAALACFCVISSAIYVFNDICDAQADRNHPVKKHRPIARSAVTIPTAAVFALVLAAISITAAWLLGPRFFFITALYTFIQILYSIILKHLVILDVMTIAAGFVLRILAGSVVISVPPSHWLILCTVFISFFLGFTKRRAELVANHSDEPTRAVLKHYSVEFLNQIIAMVTGVTIVCYALYTVDTRTLHEFGSRAMLLTLPSVMYGMFRYLYLIYHLNQGENPAKILSKDIPSILNALLWIAICIFVVRYGTDLHLFAQ
ncbi:MAG: decaprenyl-phosphate phosphoribosyltransferase [Sedimentisphaerales bacterium]|nr:decaprenyl-phosphate phosphoribosyltransferase [Sedimentisphaerales bacterium]